MKESLSERILQWICKTIGHNRRETWVNGNNWSICKRCKDVFVIKKKKDNKITKDLKNS